MNGGSGRPENGNKLKKKEEEEVGKKSFGRKMKDKLTGSTHEERVKQREIQKQIVSSILNLLLGLSGGDGNVG